LVIFRVAGYKIDFWNKEFGNNFCFKFKQNMPDNLRIFKINSFYFDNYKKLVIFTKINLPKEKDN